MPKWLHDKLEKQARKKGYKGDRKDAYVYGTLQKHGRKHSGKTKKGRGK